MRAPTARRGGGMILAMILLSLLAAATVAFVGIFSQLFESTRLENARLPTLYLAEGGLARARWALARDESYQGEQLELGAGLAAISVETVPEDSRARDIEVVAWEGSAKRAHTRLHVRVQLSEGLPGVLTWRED